MKTFIKQYKNGIRMACLLIVSYLTGISLALVSGYRITMIEWIVPCLMAFSGVVYYKVCGLLSKKELKYVLPAGFIFALTVVAGSKIDMYDMLFADVSLMDVAVYPFLGMFFSALLLLLFSFSDFVSNTNGTKTVKAESGVVSHGNSIIFTWIKAHPFVTLFLLYAVCYLPYFLTFFPGNCGNDTWKSLDMIEGKIPWSNHHPVLFTGAMFVVRKVTGFLPLIGSVAVFSFIQMLVLAATLAWFSMRILKICVHPLCKGFCVLFFAFHPFVGMYSVYLTKDVYFSIIMLILLMKLYDMIKTKGEILADKKECVKLSFLFLLASMLRNNAMYIAIVMAVIFLFLYKKYRSQVLVIFVCAIGLFQIWKGPVFSAMDISMQSFAEAASIPLQQVGYVLWEGKTFSDEDMAFLERLMPVEKVKEVYMAGLSDPYKFDEEFDDAFLNENKGQFLKVWWHGCQAHFGSYVKAYLMQTCGYWHYGQTNTVCTQGCTPNELGVEQIDVIKKLTGLSLEPVFEKLVLAGRKAPFICMLGSMAMQMGMVFLLILQYLRRKNVRRAVWLLPPVILWGTLLIATPASCLLRYLYIVFLLWPFLIAEFLSIKQE